ncbi:membrane protein FAM174-like [Lytechinus variegatus]|uniref:membrane protein FAM174-like n=1 Tax=Lytechinus variegatus TaxID=7654 RepID=UPI001BB2614E|nr:membrane protein FAM174-like [Lytechinus variegatus]
MGIKLISVDILRMLFFFNTMFSKVNSSLLYFLIGFLGWQLDLALAADPDHVGDGEPAAVKTTPSATPHSPGSNLSTSKIPTANTTSSHDGKFDFGDVLYDKSMLRRSFFVLIGFTLLAIVFFAVRWFRSRGKRKSKKYGVLATRSSDMELRPLDQDDDEEDMTVFDVNSK